MAEFAIEYVNRLFGEILDGSRFVACDELMTTADKSGASEKFMEHLRLIPEDDKFDSVEGVMKALERVPID
jgi:hypothetical protein